MAGHKYIKKVRLPSGKWRYYYKDDTKSLLDNAAQSWYYNLQHDPALGGAGQTTGFLDGKPHQNLLNGHLVYHGTSRPKPKAKNVGAGKKKGRHRNAVKAGSVGNTKQASRGKNFVQTLLSSFGGTSTRPTRPSSVPRPHKVG